MSKMSKVQRKSNVYIYADSHGCDHHYFSEQFKQLFTYSKRFKIQKINAKSDHAEWIKNERNSSVSMTRA